MSLKGTQRNEITKWWNRTWSPGARTPVLLFTRLAFCIIIAEQLLSSSIQVREAECCKLPGVKAVTRNNGVANDVRFKSDGDAILTNVSHLWLNSLIRVGVQLMWGEWCDLKWSEVTVVDPRGGLGGLCFLLSDFFFFFFFFFFLQKRS